MGASLTKSLMGLAIEADRKRERFALIKSCATGILSDKETSIEAAAVNIVYAADLIAAEMHKDRKPDPLSGQEWRVMAMVAGNALKATANAQLRLELDEIRRKIAAHVGAK